MARPNTFSQTMGFMIVWLLLAVAAVAGLVHSARAGAAQVVYRRTKFGPLSRQPPGHTLAKVEQAHSLYPYNYRFCIWAAERAYYERHSAEGREIPERVAAAERWCDRGLKLNPFSSQLQRLKTRLLARTSLPDAIEQWEQYVDWHFWDPYHHAVRVDLHVRAGDVKRARAALIWLENTRYYREAQEKIHALEPPDLGDSIERLMESLR